MDGIHDLGGRHGFGAVEQADDAARNDVTAGAPAFHGRWEASVFAAVNSLFAAGIVHNTDQFRHAIERIDPVNYLDDGYYGRWLGGVETLLVEAGVLTSEDLTTATVARGGNADSRVAARPEGFGVRVPATGRGGSAQREVAGPPRFAVGDRVRAATAGIAGHTRLPAYARGRSGTVIAEHGGWVYPDSNAHDRGEDPQVLYTVEFTGAELWGAGAEADSTVCLDLFEPYLEAV